MQSDTTVASIIIAILGQKSSHWQLNKVILSGVYNWSFATKS